MSLYGRQMSDKASAITCTTNQTEASGGLSNKLSCPLLPGTVRAKKPECT